MVVVRRRTWQDNLGLGRELKPTCMIANLRDGFNFLVGPCTLWTFSFGSLAPTKGIVYMGTITNNRAKHAQATWSLPVWLWCPADCFKQHSLDCMGAAQNTIPQALTGAAVPFVPVVDAGDACCRATRRAKCHAAQKHPTGESCNS
eukprot:scaffold71641_cov35-Prasinocladus_malaysianus.AAC.1